MFLFSQLEKLHPDDSKHRLTLLLYTLLTVAPKRGSALIWPSVLNDDPYTRDFLTDHQALPGENGVKYSANACVSHQSLLADFV